jgi:hypothetical protein
LDDLVNQKLAGMYGSSAWAKSGLAARGRLVGCLAASAAVSACVETFCLFNDEVVRVE